MLLQQDNLLCARSAQLLQHVRSACCMLIVCPQIELIVVYWLTSFSISTTEVHLSNQVLSNDIDSASSSILYTKGYHDFIIHESMICQALRFPAH